MVGILLNYFEYKNKKNEKNPEQQMCCIEVYDPAAHRTFAIYKPLEFVTFESGEVPNPKTLPYVCDVDLHLRSYRDKDGREVYRPDINTMKIVKAIDMKKI